MIDRNITTEILHKYLLCLKLQIIASICNDLGGETVRTGPEKNRLLKMDMEENEVEEEERPSQLLAILVFIFLCLAIFRVIPWITRSEKHFACLNSYQYQYQYQ